MKQNKYLIIGFIFLILSGVIIYSAKLNVVLFPTQEMELSGALEYGPLTKEFLIIQEITAEKEYLTAVELGMVSSGVHYLNENTLMVLDANYRPLYVHFFTNENMDRPQYQSFEFPDKIYVGKGGKIILCLSTFTGDKESHLAVPRMPKGILGKLSVRPVVNGDIIGSLKDHGQVFLLEGSLCIRTHESNYGSVNWFKIFLFFPAILLALLIVFADKFQSVVVRWIFVPEKIYAVLALVFGLLLVFITPPIQVPDEDQHIFRSYQLAEFNILQYDRTVPTSLVKLSDTFSRMNFNALEKTSIDEIISQRKIELNPQARTALYARDFIFPYFPQALGMFIGKIFNSSPVMLLFLGRIFNLLFAIVLIFFAIRTAPFFKWIFFLLGLMPMTLYLCASLSKDAMIIGLSFLLIALFLRFAYNQQKEISTNDLVIIFIVSFLLATSRSVYAILIGMFLLIPVFRIGSFKKYITIFMSLIITVFLATQIGTIRPLFQPKATASTKPTINLPLSTEAISSLAHSEKFKGFDQPRRPKGINFSEQKSFILNNPFHYLGIVFNSLFISQRTFQLDSFVGKLGWLNKPLPKWHINIYLLILIITALLFVSSDIKIGLTNKIVIASIFIVGVIFIETGLYLTWNPVGQDYIQDVQGRYFIPYAPLFLLLLYNTTFGKYLSMIFTLRKHKPDKTKSKLLIKPDYVAQNNRQITLYNSIYLLIVCFSVISLLSTVYVVLTGYYVVTI